MLIDLIAEKPVIEARCNPVLISDSEKNKRYIVKRTSEEGRLFELKFPEVLKDVGLLFPEISLHNDGRVKSLYVENLGYFQDWILSDLFITERMWEDRLRIAVVDDILGNRDRNRNNLLVVNEKQKELRILPIDHENLDPCHAGRMSNSSKRAYKELGDKSRKVVKEVLMRLNHRPWNDFPGSREIINRARFSLMGLETYLLQFQE